MPTLTEALQQRQMNRADFAALTGAPESEVGDWLRTGEVPEQYKDVTEQVLGGPIEPPQNNDGDGDGENEGDEKGTEQQKKSGGRSGGRKKTTKKRASAGRRRSTVSADATKALKVASTLVFASPEQQQLAQVLARADEPVSTSDGLIEVSENVMALNKTTDEALKSVKELLATDNDLMVGAKLGRLGRRELTEVYRVASAFVGQDDEDIPDGDEGLLATQVRIKEAGDVGAELLAWLEELSS